MLLHGLGPFVLIVAFVLMLVVVRLVETWTDPTRRTRLRRTRLWRAPGRERPAAPKHAG